MNTISKDKLDASIATCERIEAEFDDMAEELDRYDRNCDAPAREGQSWEEWCSDMYSQPHVGEI